MPSDLAHHWDLDPTVTQLNHGSFGASPRVVLEAQSRWRARMERSLTEFHARDLAGLLNEARAELAAFVGAQAEDLVFVTNATQGVNAVLRSMDLRPGDELLTTDHEYNACANALRYVCERAGATLVVATIPLPIADPEEVVEALMAKVTNRTRLALVDHVTSQTGLVFPIERIVEALQGRGVDVFVDGAHAPGMLELDLDRLGAAFYTGNCHKWICSPKGSALLHVRRDRQAGVRPTSISHGANAPPSDKSRFQIEFGWTGTCDPTAWLSVPDAIRAIDSIIPGGWPAYRAHNRDLAIAARRMLNDALGSEPIAPESMLGSMAAVRIPDGDPDRAHDPFEPDPVQRALWERWRIEALVIVWPGPPERLLRISAAPYNEIGEYERLAAALPEALKNVGTPAQRA
ncbi:MAG: aminotransferase class V-fold PLP-dependent enzyme [Phycisphaerales bacterium]